MEKMEEQVETWKNIPVFRGYQASNLGRIRSVDRTSSDGRRWKGRVLKERSEKKKRYYSVALSVDGVASSKRIHQLVAMAFLDHTPCSHDLVVDHINGDRLDNKLTNLQVITQRDNVHKKNSSCSSDFIGVHKEERTGDYISVITIDGNRNYLGRFASEFEAAVKYQLALNAHLNKERFNGRS